MLWELIKSVIYGIVEGITEWLPISSTGHIILTQAVIPFNGETVSSGFVQMFNYVIQLGAIIAVVVLFWNKLWPFKLADKGCRVLSVDTGIFKKKQWILWFKVFVASLPSMLGLLIDSKIDAVMYNDDGSPKQVGIFVISATLIIYGVLFIIIERLNKKRKPDIRTTEDITFKMAFFVGCFQLLAIIPGTSRSGATILGAIILGFARPAAAEFSFFLAVPTMVGVSGLKIVKFLAESSFSGAEIAILLVGMVVSFLVSAVAIKGLMSYVKRKDFSFFGYYRIALGIIVVLFALFAM